MRRKQINYYWQNNRKHQFHLIKFYLTGKKIFFLIYLMRRIFLLITVTHTHNFINKIRSAISPTYNIATYIKF